MSEKQRYREYLRKNRTSIIGLSVLSCVVSLLVVAFAYLTKLLIDSSADSDAFLIYAIATGALILAEVGFKYLYVYLINLKIYQTENGVKKQA
ncbi:MAG: hypothetical protein ACI4MC_05375, partial [Candidatus Coproplasma sp.]